MQLKQKQVTLTVAQTKKVADIIVAISIPFKDVSEYCLKKLKCNCIDEPELIKGQEEAAIAYALYETIRDKLAGSPLEVFKNKVSNVECYSIDDHLTITFKTQGTGTSLRKTCGIAMSCLNVGKLHSKYSENMKFLTGKGDSKEHFNFVSKKLAEGVKKAIHITTVGKINTDTTKLKDILSVIITKIPSIDVATAKDTEIPAKKTVSDTDAKPYPVVKCDGLSASIVAEYIRNNSNGMSVGINDVGVVIYNYGWESKHKQLKESKRITDYVHKKYTRLDDKDELSEVFAYFAIDQGFANAVTAERLFTSKLKPAKLIELLKKAL